MRDSQLNSDGGGGGDGIGVVWHLMKFMRENLYFLGSHFLEKIFGCHILTITLKMHTQFDCVVLYAPNNTPMYDTRTVWTFYLDGTMNAYACMMRVCACAKRFC